MAEDRNSDRLKALEDRIAEAKLAKAPTLKKDNFSSTGCLIVGNRAAIDHAQKGFMDECRGLQRVISALVAKQVTCALSEFAIDLCKDIAAGIAVATLPLVEEIRNCSGHQCVLRAC